MSEETSLSTTAEKTKIELLEAEVDKLKTLRDSLVENKCQKHGRAECPQEVCKNIPSLAEARKNRGVVK